MREALESVQSADSAAKIMDEALELASLSAVPEEVDAFRRFCERPLRKVVHNRLGGESIEQLFERIGHLLWMATSDANALETARAWSRGEFQWDDDSGVRHVDVQTGRPSPSPTPPRPRAIPSPPSGISVGRMRAADSRPRGVTQELRSPSLGDQRAASAPPPPPPRATPLGGIPMAEARPASAVLAITIDATLVQALRSELATHCPVRHIQSPAEIAGAIVTSGPAPVVLIDTALPSIDLPTFAGLAPVLPAGARVIVWGLIPRQVQALIMAFPIAATWIAPESDTSPGTFIRALR